MSSEKNSEQPSAYCQEEDPKDQSTFTNWNQYNQYPGDNQYPSPGGAQYPGNQYMNQPQYNVQGQVTTAVITQPGAIVYNRAPATINWMVPAVLVFLFCCWPLGLIAINAASNANAAARYGDVIEAERQSRRARTYVIASVIVGTIVITLFVVYLVLLSPSKY